MDEEGLGGVPEGTPLDRWVPQLYNELRALAGKLLSDKGAHQMAQPQVHDGP